MLDQRKERRSIKPAGIALGGLGVATILVPLAMLAPGQASSSRAEDGAGHATLFRDHWMGIPYNDPHEEGAEPGTPANGWRARLADGREVELRQLSRPLGHEMQVWAPGGAPLAPTRVLMRDKLLNRWERYGLLFRVKPTATPGGPVCAGVTALRLTSEGWPWPGSRIITSRGAQSSQAAGNPDKMDILIHTMFLGGGTGGGEGVCAFYLADSPWKRIAQVVPTANGARVEADEDALRDVRLVYPTKIQAKEYDTPIRQGEPPVRTVVTTALRYDVAESHRYHDVEVRAYDRQGHLAPHRKSDNVARGEGAARRERWFYLRKPAEIGRIEVLMRPGQTVRFTGVKFEPTAP